MTQPTPSAAYQMTIRPTFTYYGLKEGNVSISLRVVFPNGNIRNYNYDIYVKRGENSTSLYINDYFYNSNYYVFEIIYDGKVIGGGRH